MIHQQKRHLQASRWMPCHLTSGSGTMYRGSRKTIALLTVVLMMFSSAQLAQADGEVISQSALTEDACSWYEKQDARLNDAYQQLLKAHESDQAWTNQLRTAQRAWLTFRDAELALMQSAKDEADHSQGSVAPMCQCMRAGQLTAERTAQLQAMLRPIEGDICSR